MKKTGQYAKVMLEVDGTSVRVMELREWSVSVSSEKVDSSVAGDDWADHEIGRKSWEGEATCISVDQYWLDYIDDKITVQFFDHQDDPTPVYEGVASIDFERTAPHDDMIESTITFTGSGALTNPSGGAA